VRELTADRQPEPRASGRPGEPLIALHEGLEDVLEEILPDPATGVANLDAQVLVIDAAMHLDPAAIGELDGVREKIEQDLFEFVAVDGDDGVWAALE